MGHAQGQPAADGGGLAGGAGGVAVPGVDADSGNDAGLHTQDHCGFWGDDPVAAVHDGAVEGFFGAIVFPDCGWLIT